ncbi:siderophore-interacting protein [Massilia sp. 9I]|uniref:siderophore-interacting protein n=1 Tax=Massilia sp. 9I TaxID=2653152 RepID=UPI0012F38EA1|nr:siderophore-interacting protein [Massilia sp. 9I]VXB74439.1 NADPH-dependent ferric siderophore reductase, contains FAD-binding and SIP domains [Massilia sp. 9I]
MEHAHRKGVQRVRRELHIRDVAVSNIQPLGDSFLSISFQGEGLANFVSSSFDDHVKFMFDGPDGQQVRRDYTPLWYDAATRELTLEFALHDSGGASDWARSATLGQPAIIAGPRGSMIIPEDVDWHLLTGDRAALPAIRRRLAELPVGSRVIAVIAAQGADRLPLSTQADVEVHWVDSDAALLGALRGLKLPAGEGFAWFGGEAATAKQVRALLLDEKGMPKGALRVSAYWKQGVADHHENLE